MVDTCIFALSYRCLCSFKGVRIRVMFFVVYALHRVTVRNDKSRALSNHCC